MQLWLSEIEVQPGYMEQGRIASYKSRPDPSLVQERKKCNPASEVDKKRFTYGVQSLDQDWAD